jgi:hypothetical protein
MTIYRSFFAPFNSEVYAKDCDLTKAWQLLNKGELFTRKIKYDFQDPNVPIVGWV